MGFARQLLFVKGLQADYGDLLKYWDLKSGNVLFHLHLFFIKKFYFVLKKSYIYIYIILLTLLPNMTFDLRGLS